jgi:glycosyltransferase involved in cell wall biosynthesis
VLLPVHNGERFVRDAVASVLAQTYTDFELLVIDDGSIDATATVVASFNDARIRLVRNDENIGLTRSLNRGLALARGEVIARQDADDLSGPERLVTQVAYLDANPDVMLVGTWYRKIGDAGEPLGDRQMPVGDAALAWALLFYCPFVHSAVAFRRRVVVDEYKGYDAAFSYAQDYELWSRLARHHRVATIPRYLVSYRVATASMTATIGESSGEGARIAVANMRMLAEASGTFEPPSAMQHRAMYDALYGTPTGLKSRDWTDAVERIVQALDAFCARPDLPLDARMAVRAEVRASLRARRPARSALQAVSRSAMARAWARLRGAP